MKVLLVPNPNIDGGRPHTYVPLGLLSLATVMRDRGVDAEILDINGLGTDPHFPEAPEAIMNQTPDVVGFSTICNSYHIQLRIADHCKKINPDVQIIFGGPQASRTAPETVERFPQVDLVVRGEAESTIVEAIQALPHRQALARLPGLTFKDGNLVIHTRLPEPVKDLDALPLPDYGLFPAYRCLDWAILEAGRGCPYRCTFCSTRNFLGGGFRIHSPEYLVRLIKNIMHDSGIRFFRLSHDFFTVSRNWVLEFCQTLNRENLGIGWSCSSRIDCLDEELVGRLAAAGCKGVLFGIETGSQRMQKLIRKNLPLEFVIPTARLVAEHQIEFQASFIVGFPEETLEDLVQTIKLRTALKFVGGSKYKGVQLHLLSPYIGSQLYEEYGHNLGLDGFYSDMSSALLTEDDQALIKDHPDIFPSFYHFHTPHIRRDVLVRVPFLLKNLDYLLYTWFMLWQAPDLGFPLTLLNSPLLLELPGEQGHLGVGDLDGLQRVCRFIKNVVQGLGFQEHPIFDVMKYDLAVDHVMRSEEADAAMVEEFSYDIVGLVEKVKAEGFQRLPAEIAKMDQCIYFSKKDHQVMAIRMPKFWEALLTL